MKMPVTIANWMAIGTSPPYVDDQSVPPPTSRMIHDDDERDRDVDGQDARYVGKSSGPISWRPKLTERVSPR